MKNHFYELKKLMRELSVNAIWETMLSAVNGIYLINDKSSGKLYVGSAWGKRNI